MCKEDDAEISFNITIYRIIISTAKNGSIYLTFRFNKDLKVWTNRIDVLIEHLQYWMHRLVLIFRFCKNIFGAFLLTFLFIYYLSISYLSCYFIFSLLKFSKLYNKLCNPINYFIFVYLCYLLIRTNRKYMYVYVRARVHVYIYIFNSDTFGLFILHNTPFNTSSW